MTQKEILGLDADEFYNWMAFDMLKDKQFRERVERLRSEEMNDNERSNAIKAMFASISRSA